MKRNVRRMFLFLCFSISLPAQMHRIGVRVVAGHGEFYDTFTGASFVPRGNNYVRLANQTLINPAGQIFFYHSTFNTDTYDPLRAEQALLTMQQDGYNVVRVWISHACTTCVPNANGPGLNPAYIANVVDFMGRAKSHNIYVILTIDDLAKSDYYQNIANAVDPNIFQQPNSLYLTQAGINANQTYWSDFMTALQAANAPFDAVFTYELRNELAFYTNTPPLSLNAGLVQTADGLTYDMSSAADKQRMQDSNLVLWFNAMKSAIVAVDPSGLVSNSFLQPKGPNPTLLSDPRVGNPYPSSTNSTLDFISLHPYPGLGLDLPQLVQNYGMTSFPQMPVLMEEFGAFNNVYTNAQAASVLQKWQIDSCPWNFKGWVLWTWDTDEVAGPNTWTALDGGGLVDAILKPTARPNACLPNDVTVTVTSNVKSALVGQSVRFLTTLIPSFSGIPTGNATLFSDGGSIANLTFNGSSGGVFFSTSSLPVGLHWITAIYSGDANDLSAGSASWAQLINSIPAPATTLTLSVSPAIALQNQTVTLSAGISSSAGRVTAGKISFYDGQTLLGSVFVTTTGSVPSFSTAALSPGRHRITAVFFGNRSFFGSVSPQPEVDVFTGQ